jgi:hypothetical protein
MPKVPKRLGVPTDGHVLGDPTFAAITAVEGISLSVTSRKRLASMRERNLTPQEQRDEVIRAYIEADKDR